VLIFLFLQHYAHMDLWTFKHVYSLYGRPLLCTCLRFNNSVIDEYDDDDNDVLN